jgi:flagellar biogenesis protein FliO
MLLVLAGLGGAAFWLKRKRGGKVAPSVAPAIRVVSSTRVGPKAHAVVANVAGRVVLLGVTDHSVQRLAWLDAPAEDGRPEEAAEEADALFDPPGYEPPRAMPAARFDAPKAAPASGRGFGELLRSALGKSAPEPPSAALAIAESTQDHYSPSAPRAADMGRRKATEPMLSVESQAAGLVARLQELGR